MRDTALKHEILFVHQSYHTKFRVSIGEEGCPQGDSAEHEEYVGAQSVGSQEVDEWLRRRLRCDIWRQWKKPKTRVKNMMKLEMPQWQAYRNGNSRKGYWAVAGSGILAHSTKKRLAAAGYVKIRNYYESLHSSDETAVYRAVCTVV